MTNMGSQHTAVLAVPLIQNMHHGVDQVSLNPLHRLFHRKLPDKEREKRGQVGSENRKSCIKESLILQFEMVNTFYLGLTQEDQRQSRTILPSSKNHINMKIFHAPLLSLLTASTLISRALSIPHGEIHSDPHVAKRASRVAYAGINIAGCDFGMDTNVSRVHFTPHIR